HDPNTVQNPGNYRVYVGIDPTGGTDWASSNIVWSEPAMQYNTWMQLSVTAVAKAGTITVYTRGQPEFRTQFNDSYWDDACLTIVRPQPTNTPVPKATNTPTITSTPADTPTPTDTPSPTATATPLATPTPRVAYVCVRVHNDVNGNGAPDPGERLLEGAVIHFMNELGEVLETYTTDGRNEPHCFATRQEGNYFLQEKNPEGYVSTSSDDWGVYVVPGAIIQIHFWDHLPPTPTPTDTPSPTATSTNTRVPTATPMPTMTPTEVIMPSPTPSPTPLPAAQAMAQAIFGVSGIIAALLGVVLIAGLRYIRGRL
ncbi:MAG: hypothetical protein H5T63_06215, partial [Chloroflexi bacterium]|nr:hypothetical protein [Chloroflexota bacterium]